jgi:hypothetical protein
MAGPLGGAGAEDPGAPIINAKKHRRRGPWEVPELKIQERPSSTLRSIDGGPSGRAGAEDLRVPTINTKKH